MGTATTTVSEYMVGTLVVDIFDAKTKALLFRGTASDEISDKPEKNIKKVEKAAEQDVQGLPAGIQGEEVGHGRTAAVSKGPPGSRAGYRSRTSSAFARPSADASLHLGVLEDPADQRTPPALEVRLRPENVGDSASGVLGSPEVPETAGPHEAAPEERGVAVPKGGLVRVIELAAPEVVHPDRGVGVGHVVGVARDGLPGEGRAPLPVAEKPEEPADHLRVDEALRTQRERGLGLGQARGGLALDEVGERQDRARPLARWVEVDGVLGEGQALLERGVGRRDLERVVRHVEPGELDPRERTLRVRAHGAPQRLQGGNEVRRLAGEEEAVRVEERPIGRSLRLGRECLAAEGLGHDAVFRGDPGGDDPRPSPGGTPRGARGRPGTPRPRPGGRSGRARGSRTPAGGRSPPGVGR